jgi:catechol 2,3-dioxygenase-like lactoylglutathione lyase family enzyme
MAAKKRAKQAKKAAGAKRGAAPKKVATAKKVAAPKKSPVAKKRSSPRKQGSPPVASILDHLTISVPDYARSKAFYLAALAPLGIELVMEWETFGGFGAGKKPAFWIGQARSTADGYWRPEHRAGAAPVHIAFLAPDRAAVDAFHAAALTAGGVDHGAPGVRPDYHPGYYGAFVIDPDGNNVEAVHHGSHSQGF